MTTDMARRLEEVHPWIMEKVKGDKTYQYWMASWREGDKVRNVHLGSCRKMSGEEALQKAKAMKAEAIGQEVPSGVACCGIWNGFYKCDACGIIFEIFYSDHASVVCPHCESRQLKRYRG